MSAKYGTACGVWGDIIVGLGYFKNTIGKGEILYLGNNQQVVDYLECQPFITKVKQLSVPEEEWKKYWIYTVFKYTIKQDPTFTAEPKDPFYKLGYTDKNFELTHLHYDLAQSDQPIYQWEGDNLPDYAEEWAEEKAKELPEFFYLYQPFSFNSNTPDDHWPHWDSLSRHIASYTNKNLVLIGHNWLPGIDRRSQNILNSKVINLYNQVPSMLHIFALAKRATGVITTSNSLGHWCQIANIPCVIICNTKSSRPHYIYRRVLEWPTITCVNHDQDMITAYNAIGENLFSLESLI
jgi:ADP-heptose:LPS heptosyltransferase